MCIYIALTQYSLVVSQNIRKEFSVLLLRVILYILFCKRGVKVYETPHYEICMDTLHVIDTFVNDT